MTPVMTGAGQRPFYKWLVVIAVMSGAFLVVLDTTVVNVALPKIMAAFGVNVNKIQWVVTAYMIAMAIMMPSVGWLSARIGNKTLFIISLVTFTVASTLCGVAWNVDALIVFRIFQGVGAGALMPIAMVIIFEAFPPEERGLAMGVYGIGATFGPAIGPTLGGYLADHFSWHLIFYINIPIGLIGMVLAAIILQPDKHKKKVHFDILGFITMSVFLGSLLAALSQGQREGWSSFYILTLFIVAAFGLVTFLWAERVAKEPFIDLSVYKTFAHTMATLVFIIQGFGLYGSTFLIPLYFESMLDYTALQAGLLMLPMALVVAIVLPLAGRMADRMDGRIPITLGVLFSALSLYWMSFVDLRTSQTTAYLMLIVRGLGIGFIFPPLMNMALKCLPPEKTAVGSGLMNVSRQIGGAFGVSIIGVILDRREVFHHSLFAQAQNLNSFATKYFLSHLQEIYQKLGSLESTAYQKALTMLHLMVKKEAMVASFDDGFLITGVTFLLALLPTVLLRIHKE
ncbi:MAG: DHA2 family efflux MFS transporter permease subunit [Deltaproteobacteria bacterium]|nr:DHA2 family efflux MFS transporter permease subunit [Deltaproteobacteria bacterium]